MVVHEFVVVAKGETPLKVFVFPKSPFQRTETVAAPCQTLGTRGEEECPFGDVVVKDDLVHCIPAAVAKSTPTSGRLHSFVCNLGQRQ